MSAKVKKEGGSGKSAGKSSAKNKGKFEGGKVSKKKHGDQGAGKFKGRKGSGTFTGKKPGKPAWGKPGQADNWRADQGGKWKTRKEQSEKFPGRKVVDPKLLEKYNRGEGVNVSM